MNLTIDIGNTNIKFGFFDNGILNEIITIKQISLNVLIDLFNKYRCNNSILSSVAKYDIEIIKLLRESTNFVFFDNNTPIPINNKYKSPESLGKDRLANACGAYAIYPNENCLIIDAGTCIKFDFIDCQKNYFGGSISPGIQMKFQALNKFTHQLPLIELKDFNKLIGTNTEESILSGILKGTTAEIDGMIDFYKKEFFPLNIILTGGDLFYLEKQLKNKIFAVPNIGLIGLNSILTYNASKI